VDDTTRTWGRIANPGHEGEKIAATLYAGGAFGEQTLTAMGTDRFPAHPLPQEEGFSDDDIRLQYQRMKGIGINLVELDYYGNTPISYMSEMIENAEREQILFAPFMDSSNEIDIYSNGALRLDKYYRWLKPLLDNFRNSPYWAEIYNQDGKPKKLIVLYGGKDANLSNYYSALNTLAQKVKDDYGVEIGYAIQGQGLIPAPNDSQLLNNKNILLIQPFNYCATYGSVRYELWRKSGYPFIVGVIAGFDGRAAWSDPNAYFGMTDEWRGIMKTQALPSIGTAGIFVGPWNAWWEWNHITCSVEEGATNLKWARECIQINRGETPDSNSISCPTSGTPSTYTCPNKVCEKDLGENSKNCPSDCFSQSTNITTGTVTDIQGNTYKTVKIGEQWWMAENLKTSKYRNGEDIGQISSSINYWPNNSIKGWVNYAWNSSNDAIYGKLYSWPVIIDSRGLCPVGWHVPTDEEFTKLEGFADTQYEWDSLDSGWTNTDFMGRGFDCGKKLKSVDGWRTGAVLNTDDFGFNAIPGGYKRNVALSFYGGPNENGTLWYAVFWTSTSSKGYLNRGWLRLYSGAGDRVIRVYAQDNIAKGPEGAYVRCIKDSSVK